jgi:paraquat-inducible protein A
MIYLLLPLRSGRVAPGAHRILRIVQATRPWGMVEVFLLGVLVSLVKLAHVAVIHPGPALWAFGALMVTMASAAMTFDARAVWARLEFAH